MMHGAGVLRVDKLGEDVQSGGIFLLHRAAFVILLLIISSVGKWLRRVLASSFFDFVFVFVFCLPRAFIIIMHFKTRRAYSHTPPSNKAVRIAAPRPPSTQGRAPQAGGWVRPFPPSPSPSLPPLPLAARCSPPRPPPASAPPPKPACHRHSPCLCRRTTLSRPPAPAVAPPAAAEAGAGAAAKAREDYNNDNLSDCSSFPPSPPTERS